ncbi:hypothetical protein T492DRAFT_1060590 [Pavlovales sp. CCMP2436]|nr:hypothetical protein T492DRAFT_1060590 [Pavlovales sp. CCMP2436]|mmetsp:Transcript_31130/g.72434  ORF Transcript_31130/g.72434 Transcript_31130/m.72434 type:complete len:574 (-) Transcript_31130:81-1802(-)
MSYCASPLKLSTRFPGGEPSAGSPELSSYPPELVYSRPQPLRRRAMTFSTLSAFKRGAKWRERMLRRRLRVTSVDGEDGLPESELGPRASAVRWAKLNRARPWWARMVHPNSFERRLWDFVTGFFVLLSVAQVPLQMAISWWPYLHLSASWLAALNSAMRVWFLCEILLNLRTGVVNPATGVLIMDGWTICWKNLHSGWLLLDLLGVIPFESLFSIFVARFTKPLRRAPFAPGLRGTMQRVWRVSGRIARFTLRISRGRLRHIDSVRHAWDFSALDWRCKQGTADTALSYCEWHEGALEQIVSVWQLCRQLQVPRLLMWADRFGYFWQTLDALAALGTWADRWSKVLYLTKWAKLRRLLHLTQLWRIGRKWLLMRQAKAREALRAVQDSLVRSLSRAGGVDSLGAQGLCSSFKRFELGPIYRVLSGPVPLRIGKMGDRMGVGIRSVPARLSELIPQGPDGERLPNPLAARFFDELRAHQVRAHPPAWLNDYDKLLLPSPLYSDPSPSREWRRPSFSDLPEELELGSDSSSGGGRESAGDESGSGGVLSPDWSHDGGQLHDWSVLKRPRLRRMP